MSRGARLLTFSSGSLCRRVHDCDHWVGCRPTEYPPQTTVDQRSICRLVGAHPRSRWHPGTVAVAISSVSHCSATHHGSRRLSGGCCSGWSRRLSSGQIYSCSLSGLLGAVGFRCCLWNPTFTFRTAATGPAVGSQLWRGRWPASMGLGQSRCGRNVVDVRAGVEGGSRTTYRTQPHRPLRLQSAIFAAPLRLPKASPTKWSK